MQVTLIYVRYSYQNGLKSNVIDNQGTLEACFILLRDSFMNYLSTEPLKRLWHYFTKYLKMDLYLHYFHRSYSVDQVAV